MEKALGERALLLHYRNKHMLSAPFGVTGILCKFSSLCLMRNYKSLLNVLLTQHVVERK